MKKLSDRVEKIIDLIPFCEILADVGCDHAQISIHLKESGRVKNVIASDLREGPLARAKANVEKKGLEGSFRFRLCSGLSAYEPGEAEVILISGMGGILIKDILTESEAVVKKASVLVLEPQSDAYLVRKTLRELNFRIIDERFAKEGIKWYPIIKAVPGLDEAIPSDKISDKFGPVLLKEKNVLLHTFLLERKRHYEAIISRKHLLQSEREETEQRRQDLEDELKDIEEALKLF